jgi:two-component system, OmpR family, response regulator
MHGESKPASFNQVGTSAPEAQRLSGPPPYVLFIDDDLTMQQMVGNYLREQNIRVTSLSNGQAVMRELRREDPGLVILDLRLGQEDGLDLLRQIRAQSDVPVIITTGHRREEIDRVIGLELGADDYVVKPFGLRELLARIRALLRRQRLARSTADRNTQSRRLRFGGWELDRRTRRLLDQNRSHVALTKSEYALLVAFLEAPQRPLTREHLLQATRVHEDVFDRSIDVQVLRLRRKLETEPGMPRIIQTERGVGYVFALGVNEI